MKCSIVAKLVKHDGDCMNISRRCLFKMGSCYIARSSKVPYTGDIPLVPTKPITNDDLHEVPSTSVPTFSHELVSHLESLSLVRFDNEQAVAHLRSAVKAALPLQRVDTTGLEPMYTVWEDQQCFLREDEPEEPLSLSQVIYPLYRRSQSLMMIFMKYRQRLCQRFLMSSSRTWNSLSLVRFDNEQAVAHLRSAVKAALPLQRVDTTGLEPMYTVWEDQQCFLREDEPEEPLSLSQVLSNANPVQDHYFTSPPGNVALEEAAPFDQKLINQWDRLGIEVAPTPKKQKRESDQ
ncbi:aspartyl/glutamyl-tRNA(Asn/Gln) amidotransferase, C subunit [Ancylostoma caninum]|uniref:Aspartyl/glutamyl-tRNA(Asn/Gln) amidotransferase, C subunit n=1 Tax=Ancylostoma caninum TaxID=29170 RepID=A0A368GAD7_ANCCA|nr:aspartyl/glutamyl-tRNA(Asn/Gln) amidotransferase, C subunit [Ancylostoma caninum]